MRKLVCILNLVVLGPLAAAWAQLAAPNDAGVSLGQWHMLVRSVEASKKFWTTLGGTPIKIDGTDVMKFPGVFIFLKKGAPSPGGNYGATLNHVAFLVPDTEAALTKWKAAGVTTEFVRPALGGEGVARLGYVYSPDDLRIRLNTDKSRHHLGGEPSRHVLGDQGRCAGSGSLVREDVRRQTRRRQDPQRRIHCGDSGRALECCLIRRKPDQPQTSRRGAAARRGTG